MNFRVGSGFDVHRIVPGEGLVLGGIYIPCGFALLGHSDADVLIHALADSMYGALAEGDIGIHFPDSSPENKRRPSSDFLNHANSLLQSRLFSISNIDITLICEKPRISAYRTEIIQNLSQLLNLPENAISVKGTTTEKLGFTGRQEGIACHATILIYKN